MIVQPIRTARLFSRRALILAAPFASIARRPRGDAALSLLAREARAMQHLMACSEPARFELSELNFLEATSTL